MVRPKFITGEIYHVYNRGTDKRDVFLDDSDYFRGIHDIFEFNDQRPALDLSRRVNKGKLHEVGLHAIKKPRKLWVEVLCFCLMPNHYHFLLRQLEDGGITEFMRKFGTGYTNYFNAKYERSGVLFQGKFKAVHVAKEAHFMYLSHYIHLNPMDLYESGWSENGLKNFTGAREFLEKYRWSSYLDYIDKKNFPSLTQNREFILGDRTSEQFKKETESWLKVGYDKGQFADVAID
jgi:putative transposase